MTTQPGRQAQAQGQGHGQTKVLAIGHRGAAGHLAENTMPSFEKALALGADGIEFDVALTRDGHAVVLHDDTLDRTTNGTGAIENVLLADVRSLDAGAWKGAAGARVPLLGEVLEAFAPRTTLNLEIKESPRRTLIVDACLGAVRAAGALPRVVFSSFDHEALRILRRHERAARIGVLSVTGGLEQAMACAAELGAENLHPPLGLVNAAMVARAHAAGLAVWTWTVNEPDDIRRALDAGVDGVFSDFPERVVAVRREWAAPARS